MNRCDIRIEWHAPDATFAAVFLRTVASHQGREVVEPWFLGGALVGLQETRDEAVADLIELANYLVLTGENFLTEGQISLEDRKWLAETLDWGNDAEGIANRYKANRRAQEGLCANCGRTVSHPGEHIHYGGPDPWGCPPD